MTKSSAGGAGAAAGTDFEATVAAYLGVHVLAEQGVAAPWDLPATVTLEWIRAQTRAAVDDLLVGTSADGRIYVQAKLRVSVSTAEDSDFADALDQMVHVFLDARDRKPAAMINRPLDAALDRLVLAVGGHAGPICNDVPAVLTRIQGLGPSVTLRDYATNGGERRVLARLLVSVRRSWRAATGVMPTRWELSEFLVLVRVVCLELDPGEKDEGTASTYLRTAVVREATQAASAWKALRIKAIQLAKTQSGVRREGLQSELIADGIVLQVVRRFREDIERVKKHTKSMLDSLAHFSRITHKGASIQLPRACLDALEREAEAASTLVTGEPGSGKSGVVHMLAEQLIADGRDVIVLAAGQLGSASVNALQKDLGLDHPLEDVLAGWPGNDPAYLIVDALDAARNYASAEALRKLIARVVRLGGRWRIVASVRKFDLRNSPELRGLFVGVGIAGFSEPLFAKVHHLNVPRLTTAEFAPLAASAPELFSMVNTAPPELGALLMVPFNLMLAAELLDASVSIADLRTIRTQLQLLDLYWEKRVCAPADHRDDRERALTSACELMIAAHSLHAPRSKIVASGPTLVELLSDGVVVAEGRYDDQIGFSHHVLFDYAVHRLLLWPDANGTVARLEADADLALSIRPSLVYWLQSKWDDDPTRGKFWVLAMHLLGRSVPAIAKLIPGIVAAEKLETVEDSQPLIAILAKLPTDPRALELLAHASNALLAGLPRQGTSALGAWFQILAAIADIGDPASARHTVFPLLSLLNIPAVAHTAERIPEAGRAARRLLELAWAKPPDGRNSWFATTALRAVIRTFASDPKASATLLRRSLRPEHLAEYAVEEIPLMAFEVERFVVDPDFMLDFCTTVFSLQGEPEHETQMGGRSRIFGLLSNAQQDIDHAKWNIAKEYGAFFIASPIHGARAAARIVGIYVRQESKGSLEHREHASFELRGRRAEFVPDFSAFMDRSSDQNAIRILDQFVDKLRELAAQGALAEVDTLLDVVIEESDTRLMWSRVIAAGAKAIELGVLIKAVLWQPGSLRHMRKECGELLEKLWLTLTQEERVKIEAAILALDDDFGQIARLHLLSILGEDRLTTDAAQQLLRDAMKPRDTSSNDFEYRSIAGGLDDEQLLAMNGVSRAVIAAPANARVRALMQPLRERASALVGNAVTPEQVAALSEPLRAVEEATRDPSVDEKQAGMAWGLLAKTATAIVERPAGEASPELLNYARSILLTAIERPEPHFSADDEANFARAPSWGGGLSRIEAAEGLMSYVMKGRDPEVEAAIERLASDPVAAVRYQITSRLAVLLQHQPALFWRTSESVAATEGNNSVVAVLLGHGNLHHAARRDVDRALRSAETILTRLPPAQENIASARTEGWDFLLDVYVERDHMRARELLDDLVTRVGESSTEVQTGAFHLREKLTRGSIGDATADAARRRALEIFGRLVERSAGDLLALAERPTGTQYTPDELVRLNQLAKSVHALAAEVYYGSDSFKEDKLTPEVRRRFYEEAKPTISRLCGVGVPAVVHHLVETFETYIDLIADRRELFLLLAKAVCSGRKGGYQYESLGIKAIVGIVERYLADHREVFRDDPGCRAALRDVLEAFVEAGWPEAYRLTYMLDDIFR